jgi:N-acetylneuraminic acid mutarotase
VSAVADPNTGVAVYDTYSQAGWSVYGGTSVATPIIASTYALAGAPVPGTYPASYPYDHPSGLNDVTTGSDGSCDPLYLCTAGVGYDGPTGLGTPDGTSAFALGAHGEVTGRVVTARGNRPLPGAEVDVGDTVAHTGADGSYTATVPAASYQVTATLAGYAEQKVPAVSVGDDQTVTENFTLRPVPDTLLTGTVTDGSGHGWALYAKVQVLDGGPVTYTDPATGRYSLRVPEDNSYRLEVAPVAVGYQPLVTTAQVGSGPATHAVSAPVDTLACDAPGYAFRYQGSTQRFNGTTVPPHWAVVNNNGTTLGWEFDNPGGIGNETGGSGGFAIAAAGYPNRVAMDTSLETPVVNMAGYQSPVVQFDTDLPGVPGRVADVDVSTDGGATWTTVWQQVGTPGIPGPSTQIISLPQAAGQARVRVRFHYTDSSGGEHWSLDNVFLGNRPCTPLPGGLVTGTVTDANTGSGIDGATVRGPGVRTVSAAMPADPRLQHGYYSLFSPSTGTQPFTAARGAYLSQTASVGVTANQTTQANFTLQAGMLKVTPGSIGVHVPLGHSRTVPVTIRNTGHAPVKVTLREEAGDSAPASAATAASARHGAPLRRVHGRFSPLPGIARPSPAGGRSARPATDTPAAGAAAWTSITGYPTPVMGNAVATDTATGTVYSFGGYNGYSSSASGYTYSSGTGQWTAAASMHYPREAPAGAIIGSKIYVTGGWDIQRFTPTVLIPQTEIYDTATGTWSQGASMPEPTAAAGVAVLNGLLYVVGGCAVGSCGQTQVQVYNPSANTWTQVAPYPEPVAWESCGAITGKIYCAGGATSSTTSTADAFSYNPATNTWAKIASLPIDLWGSGYTSSSGQLLVSGGVTSDGSVVTNQGFAYDPLAGTWSPLPASINTVYSGGSGCGFYKVGGLSGGFPSEVAEQLPGYDTCGPANVPWLSESAARFTLAPGQSAVVRVTVRAGGDQAGTPGTYTAAIDVGNTSPYQVAAVPITLHVTPGR